MYLERDGNLARNNGQTMAVWYADADRVVFFCGEPVSGARGLDPRGLDSSLSRGRGWFMVG